jgi:hypothetical protein
VCRLRRKATITGGADVKKFTLAGNKLTFKATAFEARKDATYRVKIKATPNIFLPLPGTGLEDEKTLAVTVVAKNLDDYGVLRITTAADVSTPSKICLVLEIVYVSGKHNHFVCVFRRRNIID